MKAKFVLKTSIMACTMTWALANLVGCQGANFSMESANQGSSVEEETSTGLPPVTSFSPDIKPTCSEFLMKPPVIDYSATEDKEFLATSGNYDVPEPLRTAVVGTSSGSIDIHSAITATINAQTGTVRINAQHIQTAKIGSGELCIRANHIGLADADSSSGSQVLAAKSIDTVRLGAGAFHIYKATVRKLERLPNGKAGYNGQICLHDGAKILDFGPYNPSVAAVCN